MGGRDVDVCGCLSLRVLVTSAAEPSTRRLKYRVLRYFRPLIILFIKRFIGKRIFSLLFRNV